ncbi:hypothetical protein H5410_001763 [Solanum commersonii]|uniref:Uncharacterized protein n=1 Tax=Solanum commersonii TaxID=4109 RepID=A0A9J6AZY6_SOLCO|nr:hypothetical protein H5410_001763 [Solanum commersonii]
MWVPEPHLLGERPICCTVHQHEQSVRKNGWPRKSDDEDEDDIRYDPCAATYESNVTTFEAYVATNDPSVATYDSFVATYDSFAATDHPYVAAFDNVVDR